MDEDKRKSLALAIFLGIIILSLALLYLWGAFLNRGKISFIGEPPFTVEVFGIEQLFCETSPCITKQKSGIKDLIIYKEGYQVILDTVDVPLWRTVEYPIDFNIEPYLTAVDELPALLPPPNYLLTYAEENGMYKLVDEADSQNRPIVFFPKEVKEPRIFGSEKGALIIEGNSGTAYKVNITQKQKGKIENNKLTDIETGIVSPNGKNFLFFREDFNKTFILNAQNELYELDLDRYSANFAWTSDDQLIFITNQEFQSTSSNGQYTNYIQPLDSTSPINYTFGFYHPEENSFSEITVTDQITAFPTALIPAGNNAKIYFNTADGNFALNLK